MKVLNQSKDDYLSGNKIELTMAFNKLYAKYRFSFRLACCTKKSVWVTGMYILICLICCFQVNFDIDYLGKME